jgi:23S rRNA (adenine2503-C2)-methyltransferase
LPASIPVEQALEKLVNWQNHSSKIPKIHYAFIAGQNDSQEDVHSICELINEYKLRVNINIVRYNPPSEEQGIESPIEVIERNQDIFKNKLSMAQVKDIPKVGFDVYASCGMFVNQLT